MSFSPFLPILQDSKSVADLPMTIVTKSGNRFCYPFLSRMFLTEFQAKTQLKPLDNVGHLSD